METPEVIRILARLRLREARVLVQNQLPDGAFYLAGYSVELMLKARIAERLGLSGIFDEQSSEKFDGIGANCVDFSKPTTCWQWVGFGLPLMLPSTRRRTGFCLSRN